MGELFIALNLWQKYRTIIYEFFVHLQLKTLSNYESKIKNFRGIALTGWSRYDHFAILCELLPVAVPSLLLDLLILKHRTMTDAVKELGVQLKCDLVSVDMPIGYCQWPGDGLYNLLQEMEKLEVNFST